MPRSMKNMTRFPYKFNCLCWKIALDIALLDMTSTSRLTLREWPPWCSKLCRCVPSEKNSVTIVWMWPIGDFALQSWAENLHCHCDGNYAGSSISDQNWIKNREAAASRVTLPRLNWQVNERMNEPIFGLLLFAILSLLDFLIFLSKWSAFEKKILRQDSASCLSIPC